MFGQVPVVAAPAALRSRGPPFCPPVEVLEVPVLEVRLLLAALVPLRFVSLAFVVRSSILSLPVAVSLPRLCGLTYAVTVSFQCADFALKAVPGGLCREGRSRN